MFVWFALFAASVAVVGFGPSVFSLSFLVFMLCAFSRFSPVHVFVGRRRGPCSFPLFCVVGLPFDVLFVLCVLLV